MHDDYVEDWPHQPLGTRGGIRAVALRDTNPHSLEELGVNYYIDDGREAILKAPTANSGVINIGDHPSEQPATIAPGEGFEVKGPRRLATIWIQSAVAAAGTPQYVHVIA